MERHNGERKTKDQIKKREEGSRAQRMEPWTAAMSADLEETKRPCPQMRP